MLFHCGASVERRYSFTETVACLRRQKNLDILTNSKSVELDSLHSPYFFSGAKIHISAISAWERKGAKNSMHCQKIEQAAVKKKLWMVVAMSLS